MGRVLREQVLQDRLKVKSSAIDVGEIGVGGVEEEREICASEDDGIEGFAANKCLGKCREVAVLLAICRGFSDARKFNVGVVDEVNLGWHRRDDFYVVEFSEERGLDHKAGTEDRDAAGRSGGELMDKRVENVDDRYGRIGSQFANAVVRSDSWDNGELGSGGVQTTNKTGEVFGETVAVFGLDVGENARRLGVGNDDVESAAVRVSLVGFG
jgi:hypothetical protein